MIRKLFNNRAFIIGLAVCSALLMVHSLAAPFFDEPDFSDVAAPEFYPEQDAPAELEVVAADEASAAAAGEEAIWRADQSVLSGQLTWNSRPRRDPFSVGQQEPVRVHAIGSAPAERPAHGIPRLDGLVAGPDSLFAVLNDQIVREGDLIGGYEVTRIEPDGVRIASRLESHWLSVADMVIELEPEVSERDLDQPGDELAGLMDGGEPGG